MCGAGQSSWTGCIADNVFTATGTRQGVPNLCAEGVLSAQDGLSSAQRDAIVWLERSEDGIAPCNGGMCRDNGVVSR